MEKDFNLYKLQKNDLTKAGEILADAFKSDPVWGIILKDLSNEEKGCFFQFPIRYCLKYGEVFAPTENLEGIAAWLPGRVSNMTFLRIIFSGGLKPLMKIGTKMKNIGKQIDKSFTPLEYHRNDIMTGRQFTYLMIIGVAEKHQRQGMAKKLLNKLLSENDRTKTPIYLETETKENVEIYKKFGFELIKEITLPVIDLPMWIMVREPK